MLSRMSVTRRDFLRATGLVALGFLLLPSPAQGQHKIPRIGYVAGSSAGGPRQDAFRQGLRELGYIEGKNILIEYRYAEGNPDRIPGLVTELLGLKVDVFASSNARALSTAQKATKTIPIVMLSTGDPVAAGLVASLARPGGNITGTTSLSSETSRKRVELLKEVVPGLSHLAVLWNPDSSAQRQHLKEIEVTAKSVKVQLQSVELARAGDWEGASSAIAKYRPNGLFIFRGGHIRVLATRITELAEKNRLPTMYEDNQFVKGGGLMSYGPDIVDLDRHATIYVDKILKGVKPADLPVEQPTKFELFINLKTAKAIGLKIPPEVLKRASQVIQ